MHWIWCSMHWILFWVKVHWKPWQLSNLIYGADVKRPVSNQFSVTAKFEISNGTSIMELQRSIINSTDNYKVNGEVFENLFNFQNRATILKLTNNFSNIFRMQTLHKYHTDHLEAIERTIFPIDNQMRKYEKTPKRVSKLNNQKL